MPKIWIISDTHFGAHNNAKKWEDLMCSWMNDYFFPLVCSVFEDGDVLVHLGDVFDNRQSVSLSSMNIAINFFERLSSIFNSVYVLCGNHDAYYTTKNDITSLECLKHIPNISVIKDPVSYDLFGKKCLFFPWTENLRYFKKTISDNEPDILFCHTEFCGCVMNSSMSKSENDFDIPNISCIYSGHIHHRQKYKNVTYAGSPYQLTQNDRNNTKGVWIFDPVNDKETFQVNDKSPEFIRVKYDDVKEMSLNDFIKFCDNKFVEVETDSSLMSKCKFQKILSLVQDENIMDLSFVPDKDIVEKAINIDVSSCLSISDMLDEYIDKFVNCDNITKKSVKIIAKKLING